MPESAVVAGFERIDVAGLRPAGGDRRRATWPPTGRSPITPSARRSSPAPGVVVAIGAGPLVVGPDLARGVPSDPATRAGRALALQLLAVAIARGNGVPDDQIVVGGLTPWLVGETEPVARAAGEIALRRALLPTIALIFEEPRPERPVGRASCGRRSSRRSSRPAGRSAILRRAPTAATLRTTRRRGRSVAARRWPPRTPSRSLAGAALEHARATADGRAPDARAARRRRLAGGHRRRAGRTRTSARLGADAVAERSDPFDPLRERQLGRPAEADRRATQPPDTAGITWIVESGADRRVERRLARRRRRR